MNWSISNKFGNDSASPLNAFGAAQYMSPSKPNEMQPSASDINSLTAIPFLNDPTIIANLMKELPVYLAKADSVCSTINVLDWWKQNEHYLIGLQQQEKQYSYSRLLLQQKEYSPCSITQAVQLTRKLHQMLTTSVQQALINLCIMLLKLNLSCYTNSICHVPQVQFIHIFIFAKYVKHNVILKSI